MGVSSNEKVELAFYELKDVAQRWCTQYRDNRDLRVGHITWEVLRRGLLDRFFRREKKEEKVEEFISLH